ncbi:MAG: carbohydrate porin [Candidatus Omnitrophota bacterium]
MKSKGRLFLICSLILLPVTAFGMEMPDILLEKPRKKLEDKGIVFSTLYTGDMVSNLKGGLERKATYVGDVEISLAIDLEKIGLIPGGKIYVSGDDSHGGELPTNYVGDFQTVDNLEAPDAMRLYVWWYEQSFFKEKLSVLVGAQDLSSEFAVSRYGNLFINSSFAIPPDFSMNIPVSYFPYAGLGARIKIKPHEQVEFLAGIYDGDPTDNGKNRHGVSYRLSSRQGLMAIAEGAYHQKIKFNDRMKPLTGSVKFGSWLHTQNIDDVLSIDANGSPLAHRNDFGFYGVIDQMLFREKKDQGPGAFFCQLLQIRNPDYDEETEPRGLGAFFQFGGAPNDRNTVSYYFGAGLNYTGLVPGRGRDVLGIAVANAFISGRLRESRDREIETFDPASGGAAPGELRANESTLETTYRIRVNDHASLQPDYQIVFNPSGEQNTKTAHVFILRFEIGF